jgi:hypothetical protein
MKTQTINTYTYDELSDEAKEAARDWFRAVTEGDTFYAEGIYDDAEQIAALMGIEIARRNHRNVAGRNITDLAIYWSGFSSQGDGACFTGTWSAAGVDQKALKEYAPQDKELHRIAAELADIAERCPAMNATITHRGPLLSFS